MSFSIGESGAMSFSIRESGAMSFSIGESEVTSFSIRESGVTSMTGKRLYTVNPEIFQSILFSRKALKDIFATFKICD